MTKYVTSNYAPLAAVAEQLGIFVVPAQPWRQRGQRAVGGSIGDWIASLQLINCYGSIDACRTYGEVAV